jgi:hypothetical protein
MSYCSNVPPGGQASLACLKEHSSSLSGTCAQAVGAIGGSGATPDSAPPQTAPAPSRSSAQQPSQSQVNAVRQSCRSDYMSYCSNVPPGGQASLACLKEHESSLSGTCAQAVGAISGSGAAPEQAASAPSQGADPTWPHIYRGPAATVTVYEPQVISWPDHATLNARAAVSVQDAGSNTPVLGTVEVSLKTETDTAARRVILSDPKLIATHFPTLDTAKATEMETRLSKELPRIQTKSVPLDMVLLGLKEDAATPEPQLDNTPPVIFHSERPASLVLFDGAPVLAPIKESNLQVVVNASWHVFFDPAGNGWYLLNDGAWYRASDHAGPYQPATTLPDALMQLPATADFADVRKNIPGRKLAPGENPVIFVSDKPAEIIVTHGPPDFAPVASTALQRASNTDSVLFRDHDGKLYYLTSGRWFSAASLDGPWTFATPNLPTDFAMIPPDGPSGSVLQSVPGSVQAQQAVLEARAPHQATLKRGAATFQANYAGAPQFKPIGSTGVSYAANSSDPVMETGGEYYACKDGAWFVAASPTGPWSLADKVPPAIYTIPPSSPAYPVTYVKVYDATPEAVTYGYDAGYMMGFISAGVVVYGTGYYYPPVVVPGPVPIYYPYPRTYAGGVYYNDNTGMWAHGGAVYGPYGGASAWAAYNPNTGFYAHGSATWDNGYGTAYAGFNNPTTGRSGSTTQNVSPYGRWGSSVVSGPNQTVQTASGRNAQGAAGGFSSSTGAEGAGVHGAGGRNAGVVKGAGGNVYAGADGNAYKHTDDGWSKWDNGGWQPVTPPSGNGRTQGNSSAQDNGRAQGNSSTQGNRSAQGNGSRSGQPGQPAAQRNPSAGQGKQFGGGNGQLEQDRFARERGNSAEGGRFAGWSGRGGFAGGGRLASERGGHAGEGLAGARGRVR